MKVTVYSMPAGGDWEEYPVLAWAHHFTASLTTVALRQEQPLGHHSPPDSQQVSVVVVQGNIEPCVVSAEAGQRSCSGLATHIWSIVLFESIINYPTNISIKVIFLPLCSAVSGFSPFM